MNMAEVKSLVRIDAVVRRYHPNPLRREGHHLVTTCPFHQDKGRPNLVVFPGQNNYKCFACGAQGDPIDFVARILHLGRDGQAAAAQILIRDFGLQRAGSAVRHLAPPAPARTVQELDLVYSALLSVLDLAPGHLEELHRRGLSDNAIHRNVYRTLPPPADRPDVMRRLLALLRMPAALRHVPGFARSSSTGEVTLFGAPGLLIPIRTTAGQVRALQVRPDGDHSRALGKYQWLSTPDTPGRQDGTSSGAPCHVSGQHHLAAGELWITEGALKADVLSDRRQVATLAVPGAAVWRGAPAIVRLLQPRRVVIAFDQDRDPDTRRQVGRHALALRDALAGYDVAFATWEPDKAKGIDDALVAGVTIHV